MATTTNFGWETPDDTDLVKDGAAAIRTALGGVDTSFIDLKGGTTGQVLSKTTATDLDYTWITPAGGTNWSLLNAGGTTLSGSGTVTVSGISGIDKIMVLVESASTGSSNSFIRCRVNTLSTAIYTSNTAQLTAVSSWAASNVTGTDERNINEINLASMGTNAASNVDAAITFTGCNSSGVKQFMYNGGGSDGGGSNNTMRIGQGFVNTSATISSISILVTSGSFDAGTVFVYTSA